MKAQFLTIIPNVIGTGVFGETFIICEEQDLGPHHTSVKVERRFVMADCDGLIVGQFDQVEPTDLHDADHGFVNIIDTQARVHRAEGEWLPIEE